MKLKKVEEKKKQITKG